MRRSISTVLALVLVVSTLAAVPAVMGQQTETATTDTDENATVAPGAQLSGVVAVGESELSGDVDSRAYGIAIANASSDEARAAIVAERLNETDSRLAELETERAALADARENGSLSEGEYRARTASLYAESQSAQRILDQSNDTASELPAATLEANGVNTTAITTLSQRAANLTGPETAAIAQTIAGQSAGQPIRPDAATATDRGPRTEVTERPDGSEMATNDPEPSTVTTETTPEEPTDTDDTDGATRGSSSDGGSAGAGGDSGY